MRVITWNVNSIRQRLPRLLALLARHEPEVVLLQETKVVDDAFPFMDLAAAGYEAVTFGQKSYNGVAILAKQALPITDAEQGFPDDPVPAEARVLAATIDGTRFVCAYVVNGKQIGDPAYDVKLAWLDALRVYLAESLAEQPGGLLIAGDFNVAPDDRDVHDPALWAGRNLASDPERARIRAIEDLGLTDLGRAAAGDVQGPFTYWDYRMGAFHRGWGLRIDLLFGSQTVADSLASVEVDREERKSTTGEGKPSDHAPVVLTLK